MSLIISFVCHGIIFFAFQKASPFKWPGDDLRTYRVELIRSPVEDIPMDEVSERDIARIKHHHPPPPEDAQETIYLDTKDKRYATYARMVKDMIMQHWRYPAEAKEKLLEGRLGVIFSLARRGNMTQVRLLQTSGYDILDEEAIEAISTAAPFPPFPEHITVTQLHIKATFDYRLVGREQRK